MALKTDFQKFGTRISKDLDAYLVTPLTSTDKERKKYAISDGSAHTICSRKQSPSSKIQVTKSGYSTRN